MGTILPKTQGSKAKFTDSFVLHKLHSLSGVLPIGGFLIFHLTANAYSLQGKREFNTVVDTIGYFPFVQILEWALIFLPILFHSIYGLMITSEMRANSKTYQYGRNWLYMWQRVSGVLALAFIIYHVSDTWGAKKYYEMQFHDGTAHHSVYYPAMAWRFASIPYLLIYVAGIFSAASHLGNGIFNFAIRWGLAVGKSAQTIFAFLGWAIGIGLTGLGILTAGNFWYVGLNYEGKGPIRQQYATLDKLVKFEAEKEKAEKAAKTGAQKASTPAESGEIAP